MEDKIISETPPSKEDTLLNHLDISISESEKRANGTLNIRDYYTVYLIETKLTNAKFENRFSRIGAVWRRYTEFEQLRVILEESYPFIVLPPLPEKRVTYGWQMISNDTFDPSFIDRRRAGLENFIMRIASHAILCWDRTFCEFLQNDNEWRQETAKTTNGYIQSVENKLKNFTLKNRTPCPPRFDAIAQYSVNLQHHLRTLLKSRARIAECYYTVHKLHANYGRVFSEWSAVECWNGREMGDALQKTGHYLDSLASCIDTCLEDEELLVADQLKEYLFFGDALQAVCRARDLHQVDVNSAEDLVVAKNNERNRAAQNGGGGGGGGGSGANVRNSIGGGLMSRLFGAMVVDTDEVRELRVNQIDEQIREGAERVAKTKGTLHEFTEGALLDYERFQEQKIIDLSETLSCYAFLQLKTARKGLQTWTQIRDCLQNIPS